MEERLYENRMNGEFTHREGLAKASINKVVLTRSEWDGFHFVSENNEYCILLKTGEILRNVEKKDIYNIDSHDWIVAHPTKKALSILESNGIGIGTYNIKDIMMSAILGIDRTVIE